MSGEVAARDLACRDVFGDEAGVGFSDDRFACFFLLRLFEEGVGFDRFDHSHRRVYVGGHLRLNGGNEIAGSSRPVMQAALFVVEKAVIAIGLSAVLMQSIEAVALERFLQLMSVGAEFGMLITRVVSTPSYFPLE
ncbi:hypothetical protein D2E70_25555 [Mycobacteroides abscessus]|uniref:hypothetical protein n=1 Tax=Mycobacteroides abscessus TaxID=36809 RepID=UPI000E6A56EC|nr:hypothetical protein [Mycobacteroides abscessus]RIS64242.1 hypothetical protein D2E70_25555 [Mycobacteroides abscessus]